MNAKDLVVDDDAKCKKIEHVREIVPHVGIAIFARAFRIKAVGLCNASRLVVASD